LLQLQLKICRRKAQYRKQLNKSTKCKNKQNGQPKVSKTYFEGIINIERKLALSKRKSGIKKQLKNSQLHAKHIWQKPASMMVALVTNLTATDAPSPCQAKKILLLASWKETPTISPCVPKKNPLPTISWNHLI
jgi:hypothetical protein